MIDLKDLRERRAVYEAGFAKKRAKVDVEALLKLDETYRKHLTLAETLRAEKNRVSKLVPTLKDAEKKKTIAEMKTVDEKLKKAEALAGEVLATLREAAATVPNPPHESVPEGEDDTKNAVIKTWGKPREFDFEPLDHVELGKRLDLIDIESGTAASGARFYYLKNEAVLLEFALVNWLLQKYVQKGFTPITVPMLVKEHMMYATGFFPADKKEIYHVNPAEDDLYLIGTSEVSLAGLHMNAPIAAETLPRRYIGFSSCFRREAGSYGKDTKGILRVHQFEKLEMFSYCPPEKSWEEHDFLRSIEEEILQELKLPYQVLNICGGDLGAPAAKKYDCEVWIPTQKKYRELTSCSNCTDYQARRGGLRMKDDKGTRLLHTLNGTAMASTRTLIAILENYQEKDGTVRVPDVLRPYLPASLEFIHP